MSNRRTLLASRAAQRPRPRLAAAALGALVLSACATVRQDQVGVKRTFGKVSDETLQPGAVLFTPGVQGVVRVPSRTVNREVRLELPSKEGLNVAAEVSILYRVKPEMAPAILRTAGVAYEDVLILPVFRSAAADVTARFLAKDMYSGERVAIEKAVQQQMTTVLDARGFVVEQVLLKSIRLPAGLAQAVEDKLSAEQRAEQMRFVLERERQEAERKRIEAEGVRASQQIIGASLTPMLINFESIRAFRELATSPNAKVIVTDGRTPYFLGQETSGAAAGRVGAETTLRGGRAAAPATTLPPVVVPGSP
jgi:regulator of protease activity HflC (stomatin/prohibitin superfamily)